MKFKLTEKAYINDLLLEPGTVIGTGTRIPYDGLPGPHMEPVDDEAKTMFSIWRKDNPDSTLQVFNKLPIHEAKPPVAVTAADMAAAMEKAMAALGSQITQALATISQHNQGATKR